LLLKASDKIKAYKLGFTKIEYNFFILAYFKSKTNYSADLFKSLFIINILNKNQFILDKLII